ncbi:DUF6452 family protein [uncultured Sunxiuqinia sp.]|uniref:DUF6452 family protein n=1 Tax=uncultured Sunxiuqinia sp. TaxID=1573825 RepID=UPI002AA8798A|nr:DUF6452 family protein [uncultured Sunxiuqinia sp.]
MKNTLLYILILVGFAISCDEVYESPPHAFLEVSLENIDSLDASKPKVTVYGIGREDTIYNETTDLFLLPLSMEETTSFVLLLDSIADTLIITHENELIFESAETGFYNEFKILDVDHTFNRIDSYDVTDSLVTKNWHENIKFYINPLPNNAN